MRRRTHAIGPTCKWLQCWEERINAFIAKYILKIGFVSLPNLTLDREVFPELLQERCNVDEIEKYILKLEKNRDEIDRNIQEVRKRLSGKNVVESYGDFLMKGER